MFCFFFMLRLLRLWLKKHNILVRHTENSSKEKKLFFFCFCTHSFAQTTLLFDDDGKTTRLKCFYYIYTRPAATHSSQHAATTHVRLNVTCGLLFFLYILYSRLLRYIQFFKTIIINDNSSINKVK